MEVVDHIPVVNFRNRVMVSKVPFDIVTQGLVGTLRDAAQIPSGFGARAGCLVVLDESDAEVLPAVDRAGRKGFKLVLCLAAHHHREVRRHDVVICNTRFIKEHKPSNHIRARIKSHVYTTE